MAVKTKATAQVDDSADLASFNPDEMASGGLKDDFDGTILKARVVPWDYDGKLDHHILACALTIQDVDDEPFVQHYSMGNLEEFAPSIDGKEPVDLQNGDGEELEGYFAKRVGKKEKLNNNSNFAQFVGALLDAGFDRTSLSSDIRFLEGIHGHFNRIPQKKRSGIVVDRGEEQAGGRKRNQDILVITELKEAPKGAKTVAPKAAAPKPGTKAAPPAKAAPKGKEAPAEANGESLDDRLRAHVTEAVLAAEEGLPKAKLSKIAIDNFQGAEKAKAIKRIQEPDFLESSETWTFDADSATLFSNA